MLWSREPTIGIQIFIDLQQFVEQQMQGLYKADGNSCSNIQTNVVASRSIRVVFFIVFFFVDPAPSTTKPTACQTNQGSPREALACGSQG